MFQLNAPLIRWSRLSAAAWSMAVMEYFQHYLFKFVLTITQFCFCITCKSQLVKPVFPSLMVSNSLNWCTKIGPPQILRCMHKNNYLTSWSGPFTNRCSFIPLGKWRPDCDIVRYQIQKRPRDNYKHNLLFTLYWLKNWFEQAQAWFANNTNDPQWDFIECGFSRWAGSGEKRN